MRVVCFPTKWGKWREREDFEGIINCSIKGNVGRMHADITIPHMTGVASACKSLLPPSNTSVSISPSPYYPDHFTKPTAIPWMFVGLTWRAVKLYQTGRLHYEKFVHVMSYNSCSLLKVNIVLCHCVICRRDPTY
jgi:hypothetical protein